MRVLITGGTGTIGRELLKQFYLEWDIRVFSRDELKQALLRTRFPKVDYRIGDVRDFRAVRKAMEGVDLVFHCAAMKRIEVCEQNPLEAVKTNVLGSDNVVTAALERGVRRLVSISTDKNVEPINAYGMAKALQEKIVVAAGYNCARYGNVFGSRGSVVPLFAQQAQEGGPITVTHPEMTRFVLTPADAVRLILQASEEPMEGRILVKKSPAVRVLDLARCFGDRIAVIGKIEGEKLHETLISAEETTRRAERDDFWILSRQTSRQQYGKPYSSDQERLLTEGEIRELIETWAPSSRAELAV